VSNSVNQEFRGSGEEIFRALLESAPDAMVVTASDLTISLANTQTETLFGYTRQELSGAPVDTLMAERSRETARNFWARFESEQTQGPTGPWLGLHGLKKDGSEFPAELSLSSVSSASGQLVISSIRDVTSRVSGQKDKERLQARLRQAQRLESLGQLAGGVAHDFNNLLAVILHYTELVGKSVDEETLAANIAKIKRAAEKGAALTRQLLIFSRRETVRPTVLDVNEVVENMAELLRRTLGEHVDLVTNISEDLPAIRADLNQLEQLLINLAVNARDAMADGGKLTIATSETAVESSGAEADAGRFVTVEVQDTGVGMDEEVLARAVDPFFTTKPSGTASGMGLPTAYGIVTRAGGFMEIESQEGVGTTVRLLFPVAQPGLENTGSTP